MRRVIEFVMAPTTAFGLAVVVMVVCTLLQAWVGNPWWAAASAMLAALNAYLWGKRTAK